jgi:hypothetical protein
MHSLQCTITTATAAAAAGVVMPQGIVLVVQVHCTAHLDILWWRMMKQLAALVFAALVFESISLGCLHR